MQSKLEVIVMGCGPSGGTPSVRCLTRPADSTTDPCDCCRGAADSSDSLGYGGSKNVRTNTGALVVKTQENGEKTTIVIDCGKHFHARACEEFPRNGLRKIDAVLLTHSHLDAIASLDDLRHFSLFGEIQDSVQVYCDQTTFDLVKDRFPYLVDVSAYKTAGQKVALQWHVFGYGDVLNINGIEVKVHEVFHSSFMKTITVASSLDDSCAVQATETVKELMKCATFEIDNDLLYMSDAHLITGEQWKQFKQPGVTAPSNEIAIEVEACEIEADRERASISHKVEDGFEKDALPEVGEVAVTAAWVETKAQPTRPLESSDGQSDGTDANRYRLVFLDGCNDEGTGTHFGYKEWSQTALRLGAARNYLVQMEHIHSYAGLEALGEEIDGTRVNERQDDFVEKALGYIQQEPELLQELKKKKAYIRPAFDGLRIRLTDDEVVEY